MRTLNIDNIILFHEKIIKETGGIHEIRDKGLIESALNWAFMTYDNKDLYPSIIKKIAVVTYSLINNHGFADGNKRIGIAVMLIFLKMNIWIGLRNIWRTMSKITISELLTVNCPINF